MKIIVGSNGYKAEGYLSTDLPEVDITKPLPWESDSIEEIFASHVPEHVAIPDCFRFFEESYRVLQAEGILRLSMPGIGWWLTREHIKGLCTDHGHLGSFNEELLRTMLYGAGFAQHRIERDYFDPRIHHHHLTIGSDLNRIESINLLARK